MDGTIQSESFCKVQKNHFPSKLRWREFFLMEITQSPRVFSLESLNSSTICRFFVISSFLQLFHFSSIGSLCESWKLTYFLNTWFEMYWMAFNLLSSSLFSLQRGLVSWFQWVSALLKSSCTDVISLLAFWNRRYIAWNSASHVKISLSSRSEFLNPHSKKKNHCFQRIREIVSS